MFNLLSQYMIKTIKGSVSSPPLCGSPPERVRRCRSLRKSAFFSRGHRSGMTLIEVIIVMSLIAVALTVTSPSLSRFLGGRSLENEARRLLGLTRYAQNQAISMGETLQIDIALEKGSYTLTPQSMYAPESIEEMTYQLAEDITFDSDEMNGDDEESVTITFHPDGTIEGEDIVLITARGERIITLTRTEIGAGYIIESVTKE